jgi:hypothetical protein
MKFYIGILASGTGCVARTAKIRAVSGDKGPIAFQDCVDQFPILPSALANPGYMGSRFMASLKRKLDQFRAQTFVNKQSHDASFRVAA